MRKATSTCSASRSTVLAGEVQRDRDVRIGKGELRKELGQDFHAEADSGRILVVIAAWLAGPTRIASSLRREAAPYLRERRGTTYAVVGLIFLVLILWAPVAAFHKPIGLLLLAVLMVLGTEALRRQAEAEFPDAAFGGLGDRVRATVAPDERPQSRRLRQERARSTRSSGSLP